VPVAEAAARRVACLSMLLYAGALAAEVLPGWRGWRVLLSGWREALVPGADPRVAFGWLANPLIWASWVCVLRCACGKGTVLAAAAVLLGVEVHFGTRLVANGARLPMPRLGAAYWLWLAGLLVALLAAAIGLWRRNALMAALRR
jgi:hypothetical protein